MLAIHAPVYTMTLYDMFHSSLVCLPWIFYALEFFLPDMLCGRPGSEPKLNSETKYRNGGDRKGRIQLLSDFHNLY
jgi:hypothetical protein